MTLKHLLRQSISQFEAQPTQVQRPFSRRIFTRGARWMFEQLPPRAAGGFDPQVNFGLYGGLKYGSSLLALLAAAGGLARLHVLLLPLAGLAFYLVEVHFLFLFPLLLDRAERPLQTSVRATYRVGIWRALGWTLCIGAFMLAGLLLDRRQPWRRWHIGCLAIIRWYHHEVRAGVLPKL